MLKIKIFTLARSKLTFLLLTLLLSNVLHAQGLIKPADADYGVTFVSFKDGFASEKEMPLEFDLRDYGYVSPVRNQGSCGSCWAFSTLDSYESSMLMAGERDVFMSTQHLVNCLYSGCRGGYFSFDYIQKKGVTSFNEMPYEARNGRCKENFNQKNYLNYWWRLGKSKTPPTALDIKAALLSFGAVSVTVRASGLGRGGDIECSRRGGTDHMTTIVGWRADGKWIMKNSWGSKWGDKGYAYVGHLCGSLAEEAAISVYRSVPVYNDVPHVQLKRTFSRSLKTVFSVSEYEDTDYTWYVNGIKLLRKKHYITVNTRTANEVRVVAENKYAVVESKSKVGE